jgi:hypothetical protein
MGLQRRYLLALHTARRGTAGHFVHEGSCNDGTPCGPGLYRANQDYAPMAVCIR